MQLSLKPPRHDARVVETPRLGNHIREFALLPTFHLSKDHVGRYSRGLASFAYDTAVILWGARFDRRCSGMDFGASTRAIVRARRDKRAVGF